MNPEFIRSSFRPIVKLFASVKLYYPNPTLFEYNFILANPILTFVKLQEAHQRKIIQALQIIKITPASGKQNNRVKR